MLRRLWHKRSTITIFCSFFSLRPDGARAIGGRFLPLTGHRTPPGFFQPLKPVEKSPERH